MNFYHATLDWIERRIFTGVVAYTIYPLVILGELSLFPLLVWQSNNTQFVLTINSYLNVFSVTTGAIVLFQSVHTHKKVKEMHDDMKAMHNENRQDHKILATENRRLHKQTHDRLNPRIVSRDGKPPA